MLFELKTGAGTALFHQGEGVKCERENQIPALWLSHTGGRQRRGTDARVTVGKTRGIWIVAGAMDTNQCGREIKSLGMLMCLVC